MLWNNCTVWKNHAFLHAEILFLLNSNHIFISYPILYRPPYEESFIPTPTSMWFFDVGMAMHACKHCASFISLNAIFIYLFIFYFVSFWLFWKFPLIHGFLYGFVSLNFTFFLTDNLPPSIFTHCLWAITLGVDWNSTQSPRIGF